ncbi:exonuclease SbcC [Ligilactobacillus ceti]|uniref:Exonuclease SbcC n=1 Tax=Ligilactobacillus ceti DSM 22408 TaxID=1122146 RepID=A0A0R2KMG7_9LACO|nr:exonuclease SbcC [Ligilactobacillus ceti]KRN88645.1 hypothetical protein IV53_GL000610 [Ligilactobacillus ceti DSM 22408]
MDSEQIKLADHQQATTILANSITDKIQYLQTLDQAIQKQDDRMVYQLINTKRYQTEVLQKEDVTEIVEHEQLVQDVNLEISEFLSEKLIKYINEIYPFFYFEKVATGQYQFYFGNWWGRRLFGELDVLNVAFKFNEDEFYKLSRAFSLEAEKTRFNSQRIHELSLQNEELQALIDNQGHRDAKKAELRARLKEMAQEKVMPWESNKHKEAKQNLIDEIAYLASIDERTNSAYQQIRQNEKRILELSKEDTLLGYEKQSIVAKFGDFANFQAANERLYRDYIANLIATKG